MMLLYRLYLIFIIFSLFLFVSMVQAFCDNQIILAIYVKQLVLELLRMMMLIHDIFLDFILFIHNINLM